jgi:hypothetical protein
MATLGDILSTARNSAGRLEAWLGREPGLDQQVTEAARSCGLGIAPYARMAVADFSRFANEEDWATLVSSLRDSADPATTCLVAMVRWRLAATTCSGHSPHHMEGTADG